MGLPKGTTLIVISSSVDIKWPVMRGTSIARLAGVAVLVDPESFGGRRHRRSLGPVYRFGIPNYVIRKGDLMRRAGKAVPLRRPFRNLKPQISNAKMIPTGLIGRNVCRRLPTGLNYTSTFTTRNVTSKSGDCRRDSSSFSDADEGALRGLFARDGHATPRWTCAARRFARTAFCLCAKRATDYGRCPAAGPTWRIAGEAVAREVWEESGYRVRAVQLLAAYDRNKHPHPLPFHAYKLFFSAS